MKCFDPSVTKTIDLEAQTYLLNDKNYLIDFSCWDEHIRDWLASNEKIELNEEHLFVIDFLRKLFSQNRQHPVLRTVTQEMNKQYGSEKGTIKHFHSLFPGGIHQAFLIAGLSMQDSCC